MVMEYGADREMRLWTFVNNVQQATRESHVKVDRIYASVMQKQLTQRSYKENMGTAVFTLGLGGIIYAVSQANQGAYNGLGGGWTGGIAALITGVATIAGFLAGCISLNRYHRQTEEMKRRQRDGIVDPLIAGIICEQYGVSPHEVMPEPVQKNQPVSRLAAPAR